MLWFRIQFFKKLTLSLKPERLQWFHRSFLTLRFFLKVLLCLKIEIRLRFFLLHFHHIIHGHFSLFFHFDFFQHCFDLHFHFVLNFSLHRLHPIFSILLLQFFLLLHFDIYNFLLRIIEHIDLLVYLKFFLITICLPLTCHFFIKLILCENILTIKF